MTAIKCANRRHAERMAEDRNQCGLTTWVAVSLRELDLPHLGDDGWAVIPAEEWRTAFVRRNWGPRPLGTPATIILSAGLFVLLLIGFSIKGCAAQGATISDRFLLAVEQVESHGCNRAIGDNGRARGSFQFHRSTWRHVSQLRAKARMPVATYRNATDRAWAYAYARSYFSWLKSYLTSAGLRDPTSSQLYAAWNLGPSGFRRRGFSLSRCPRVTRIAAKRLERLCMPRN